MTTGFLFDCDGTLLDTMDAWRSVETDLAIGAGIELSPDDRDRICAMTLPETCAFFHDEKGLGGSAEDVWNMIDGSMMSFYSERVLPRAGVVELLRELADRGIPCAVTSSSPQRFLRPGLTHAGIIDAFAAVLSVDDVGHSKREPHIFHRALELMGADAEVSWGVDDAVYAINAMNAAGCNTVGIFDGPIAGTFEQLTDAADVAIREFDELDVDALLNRGQVAR